MTRNLPPVFDLETGERVHAEDASWRSIAFMAARALAGIAAALNRIADAMEDVR